MKNTHQTKAPTQQDLQAEQAQPQSAENTGSELDDELLEGVSGGLVQLVNPSSSRL